ncbi:MAG: hypothetical protein CM15mP118_2350 [Alphaproteobacteria bacterium]|nr:MAG: hypothetical protein CM15mP118_2350 [Alphaproteobacteria bacterium]
MAGALYNRIIKTLGAMGLFFLIYKNYIVVYKCKIKKMQKEIYLYQKEGVF